MFTGKFALLGYPGTWFVLVNTGTPAIGDEIRVRMAKGGTKTVFVTGLDGQYDGKAKCLTADSRPAPKTAAGGFQQVGEFRPAEYRSNKSVADRMNRRQFDRNFDPSDMDDYLARR